MLSSQNIKLIRSARALSMTAFAMSLLLAGCGGRARAPQQPQGAPETIRIIPPPTPLFYDNRGGIRDSLRTVLRSTGELADHWRRATSMQTSPAQIPAVDFEREMVIIVGTGRKTAEEQIHVDSLVVKKELMPSGRREETLTIVVRSVIGCGRFRQEAFPLEIVKAVKFDGPIKWDERIMRATCSQPDPEP